MYFWSFNMNGFFRKTLYTVLLALALTAIYKYAQHQVHAVSTGSLVPIEKGSPDKKQIALTVNVVWGNEFLPGMLEVLKKNNVKVTFFVGGQWAKDNPGLLKRMAKEGHDIQSHGYSHPHPTLLSKEENKEEIVRTEQIIKKITGHKTNLFAPPYGEFNQTVLEAADELNYKTIYWSIDTIDWQKPSPPELIKRVCDKAHNGAIVLMHPTEPTEKALNSLINDLQKKGYKLVTVSEMLKK